MRLSDLLIGELRHEAATTKRLLERTPEGSLGWKPHASSRTLGELAAHVGGFFERWWSAIDGEELDINAQAPRPRPAASVSEIVQRFDRAVAEVTARLEDSSDEDLFVKWRLRHGDQVLMEMERYAVVRSMLLNHLVHHRGQLSVYLRLLEVPLPPIYGPTADQAG